MQFKTKLGLVDISNEEVLAAAATIRGEQQAPQPWARQCEGRPGDRFEHEENGVIVTVESQGDGNVYWRSQKGDEGTDCMNSIEGWHNLVRKAMDSGKVIFHPGV